MKKTIKKTVKKKFSKNNNGYKNENRSKNKNQHNNMNTNKIQSTSRNCSKKDSSQSINLQLLNRYDSHFILSKELLFMAQKIGSARYIRVNAQTSQEEEEIITILTKKYRVQLEKTYLPLCYIIKKSFFSLSGILLALSGKIYLQDIASQLPLHCFDFSVFKQDRGKERNSIRILDMCSSPGSKITQLQYFLKKYSINATIIANEKNEKRMSRLVNNVQKMKMSNISFECKDALELKYSENEKFDLILLDAPCSGNLIDDNKWLYKRDLKGIENMASLQKKLLKKAKELCKHNGYIIYSTCSLEIEENEENVYYAQKQLSLKSLNFLSHLNWKFPFEYKSENILKNISKEKQEMLKNCVRLYPPLSYSQGFFVTIFQR